MLFLGRLITILLSVGAVLFLTASGAQAAAMCTPAGGGVASEMDPGGIGLQAMTCNGDLAIQAGGVQATMVGSGTLVVTGNLVIEAGATLQLIGTTEALTITVGGDFTVATGGQLNGVGGSGIANVLGIGAGATPFQFGCPGSGAGGGGGGGNAGRSFSNETIGGSAYGSVSAPSLPGSRGGDSKPGSGMPLTLGAGGNGGAAVRLIIAGTTTLDGLITVDGAAGISGVGGNNRASGGGGSGGSILLRTGDLLTNAGVGTVVVRSVGGRGGPGYTGSACTPGGSPGANGGGGGGGRIAIYYTGQNGPVGSSALSQTSNVSCVGGLRGTPSHNLSTDGAAGTCIVAPALPPPVVTSLSPSVLGQGATGVAMSLTGSGFVVGSALTFGGATEGFPANGLTISSVAVASPTLVTFVLSVDPTASALPIDNPRSAQVRNPDTSISAATPVFTVAPAPVMTGLESGGVAITQVDRGASLTLSVVGTNFDSAAQLSFTPASISATGPAVVNSIGTRITVPVKVSEQAVAEVIAVSVQNGNQGRSLNSRSLTILSNPILSQITPPSMVVGELLPVVLTGSGFISGAQVNISGTGATVQSVQFDSFTQLTAVISVSIDANLIEQNPDPTFDLRNLTVDNGDGGVSAPLSLRLEAPPAGITQADLIYAQAGASTPLTRRWNGFGWGNASASLIPHKPDWVVSQSGRATGELLLASLAGGTLYLQERLLDAGQNPVWQAPSAPISVVNAVGSKRVVDVASVSGVLAERYLVAYGTNGGLSYQVIGGPAAPGNVVTSGAIPRTNPECGGVHDVRWVRTVANATGTEALVVYLNDNRALCAVVWHAGTAVSASGFDAASEQLLIGANGLVSTATMGFDAVYWGASGSQKAMVAWAVAGDVIPGVGHWDGASWTLEGALTASSSSSDEIIWLRLAAASGRNLVALVNSTTSGGLFGQIWGGVRWGQTFAQLSTPLLSDIDHLSYAGDQRPFDVVWSGTFDEATVVYGIQKASPPIIPPATVPGPPNAAPRSRRWTEATGWGGVVSLDGPSDREEVRWVSLTADAGGGDLLAAVVDENASNPGDDGVLRVYSWNGIAWQIGRNEGVTLPVNTEAADIAYRFSLPPSAPTVTATASNGTSPAAIGATAVNRTIDISGAGFLNVPTVTFVPDGVTVNDVRFLSSRLIRINVDIGDVAPGSYTLELTNPGGAPQLLTGGLQVLERPNGIRMSATGVGSCTPVGAASGCVLQDVSSVALEARGRGIVSGASVSFAASGIDYITPPVFSFSGPPANEGILTGLVSLAGNATPGLIDVTVTNPDSSFGTAVGELEIRSSTRVDSVSLGAVVAPQLGQGAHGVLLTVRGQNLQEGAVFEFVPAGDIIVRDVLPVSPLEAAVTVDLLPFATLGGRQVRVTNPDGGTFISTTSLLSVTDGLSIFSLSPAGVPQGQVTTVTVSGSRLGSILNASQVLVSGSGVSASNVRNATATSVVFDLTVATDADFSVPRVLTLVRDTGGQARALLTIEPVPLITGLNPGQLTSGELSQSVSITGTGFDPEAVVSVVSASGKLINQTVLGAQAINITLDTFAPATGVDLMITNPNGQSSPSFTLPLGAPLGIDLVGGSQTIDGSLPLSLDHITLNGGAVLTLQGDIVVNVINNVEVTNGTLVIDSNSSYVRLRVGGDLIVGAAGVIDASGNGFIGAKLQPGVNGKVNLAQGPGAGSNSDKFVSDERRKNSGTGGGNGGAGGDAFFPGKGGHTYDVLSDDCPPVTCFAGIPLRPGSGGGAGYETGRYWHEGGDGGGAVVLEVQGNATIDGSILADGTNGAFSATDGVGDIAPGNPTNIKGAGGGAGGSILLLVGQNGGPGVGNLSGSGTIRARGGNASNWLASPPNEDAAGSGGGGGRIALYYSGTSSFTGSVTAPGGTSPFTLIPSYAGAAGTTFVQPLTGLNNYVPDGVIQGSSNFPVTLTGANVVAGDTILFQSPLLTGGTVTTPGLTVPISADSAASVGRYTVMLRHADLSGGIVFDRFPVAPVPVARGMVPNRMVQGAVVPVDLNASFLEVTGATVEFLRGGVVQPVTATINTGTSSDTVLKLTVTAAANAPLGGYDVRLQQPNGGSFTLANGFTVTSPGGAIPAVSRIQLPEAGPGLSAIRAQVLGYDFGVPGAFNVTGVSTSPGVSMRFAPGGCPGVATDPPAQQFVGCEPNPAAEQHLDVLFDTTVVTSGLVDVTVTGAAGSSTVVGGIRINPAPVIATVVPDRGQETFVITVTGSNLQPGAVISLDDQQIQVGVTSVNNGVLTATVTVPTDIATTSTTLRVTNADGGEDLFTPWVGNPQPVVISRSPTSGLKPGLTGSYTITGKNFISDAVVDLGAGVTVLSTTVVDSTQIQITARADNDAVVGPRDLTVTNRSTRPSGVLLNGFGVGPKLILQSVTPSVVGVGGGTVVSGRSTGVTLLLGGQGMSSDLSLHDISFSAEGVERLSSSNNPLDSSTPSSLSKLANFRSIDVGGTTVTSGQMQIRVVSGTDVGVGTITVQNPDGTNSSHPFTVTPAPVISQVTPSSVIRGTQVDLSISGFNFDTINPRVCIGGDCDRGLGDAGVRVLSVQPQTPNLLIATVLVETDASIGSHAITIANKDRGRKSQSNMLEVTSGFTINARTAVAVNVGATLGDSMSGQGFSGTPQVIFLNADGSIDSTIQTSGVSATSTSVSYSVTVGGTALPGMRTVRVINGDGAVAEQRNFLLVSNGVGPTVGAILVPNSVNRLGLIGWMPRIVHNIQLLGKGFTAANLAVSFDRAGLAVSNMSVVNDGLVTFSLTMPPDTVPGAAAVTVTSAAGQDTLADALIISASPVLSSTQPAVVTSNTVATSMLINGGNIDRDVRVEVFTPGITLRDFDPAPGSQPAWIASNLVRIVYDAAASASGTMELKLVNEDGGVGRILVPVEPPARHGDAVVAYLAGIGTNGLEVRDWAGVGPIGPALASNPAGTQLPHAAASTDYQLKLHSNPVNPGEYMLAVARYKDQNFQPHLRVYRRLPGSTDWNAVFTQAELTSVGFPTPEWHGHPFDIAYEQAGAGAGLVVYGSGPGLSFVRLKQGVADVGGVVSIGGVSPNANGRPLWVRLIPQKGSQRILVMYVTHNMEVQAIIWDGAAGTSGAFISQFDVNGPGSLLTNNAAQGPSNSDPVEFVKASFDGAWESQSGRAVAFWGTDTPDNLQAATWDPVNGWAGPFVQPSSSLVLQPGRGPTFLAARAAPVGNRIAVAGAFFNRTNFNRSLVATFWDGGWVPSSGTVLSPRLALGPSSQVKEAQNFDLEWVSPTKLVALYGFAVSRFKTFRGNIQYRTWEASAAPQGVWQVGVDLPIHGPIQTSVDISKDPESNDMLAVVVVDDGITDNSAPKIQTTYLYRWNGFGWSTADELTNATTNHVLRASRPGKPDLVNHFGRTGTVAYRTDAAAPAAVSLSQVGVGSASATVQWAAPGDNGATDGQAGGYDIRWSHLTIVDDDATVLPGEIRFSDANQVPNPPLPGVAGTVQQVVVDFGAVGSYTVALKTGDRPSLKLANGQESLRVNVSALSNVLTVTTLAADPVPPEAVTDLAAVAGANPETMIQLSWTGVADDAGVPANGPVQSYDLRISTINISEVGGNNNFFTPFDRVPRTERLTPSVDGAGNTRGVSNSFLVTGLNAGTTYYFAVKGEDEDSTQYAPISNVPSLRTASAVPSAIGDLVVSSRGQNALTLSWTVPTGNPVGYEVRVASTPIVDDSAVADCAALAGQICFSLAQAALHPPAPVAAGLRQSFTVTGLSPGQLYYMAVVPVRYESNNGVLTQLAPPLALASGTTLTDPGINPTQPSAVSDLSVIAGTVRNDAVGLRWTSPLSPEGRVERYEIRWSTVPMAVATAADIHSVQLPLLPGVTNLVQTFTLTDLPENARLYVTVIGYSRSGFASTLSNTVIIHTALRRGLNPISPPGALVTPDILPLLSPLVGSCVPANAPTTGVGPVPACANGETPVVTAYRWDPTVNAATGGDFVPIDFTDATPDRFVPGEGIFVQAIGRQSVLDVEGLDQPSFTRVAIPNQNAGLIGNPYAQPVAVSSLRIVGVDGANVVQYNQPFTTAVTDGVINPELGFSTVVNGVLQIQPVTASDMLLPFRAYFIQLGGTPNGALSYFVEVVHP